MSDTIFERQNQDYNLKLLTAQRHLYSKAKTKTAIRFFIGLLTAIIFPFLKGIDYWKTQDVDIALALSFTSGIFSLLVILFLKKRSQNHVDIAAKIQEEFDVNVFDIPENKLLIKNYATPEDINAADLKFKGNREKLKNWYTIEPNIEDKFAVLLSQRSNLVWDIKQRKFYANGLAILMLLLLITSILLGLCNTPMLKDYLTYILFPLITLFGLGIQTRDSHKKFYERQELKEQEIANIIDDYKTNPNAITQNKLRSIQDTIYSNRKEHALVPDFIYKWKKGETQSITDNAIKDIIRHQQQS